MAIERDSPVRPDKHRIEFQRRDHREPRDDLGDRDDDVGQAVHVERLRSPVPVEQPRYAQAIDEIAGIGVIDRCERDRGVVQ